mgnify:CR=1 FL=1
MAKGNLIAGPGTANTMKGGKGGKKLATPRARGMKRG